MPRPFEVPRVTRTPANTPAPVMRCAVLGISLMVVLIVTGCTVTRDGGSPPGSAGPTSTVSGTSGSLNPTGTPGGSPSRSEPAPPAGAGTGTPPTSAASERDQAQTNAGRTPSGAPRTGGGSGPGVRQPVLLAAGILLMLAAGALLTRRMWPPDMRP